MRFLQYLCVFLRFVWYWYDLVIYKDYYKWIFKIYFLLILICNIFFLNNKRLQLIKPGTQAAPSTQSQKQSNIFRFALKLFPSYTNCGSFNICVCFLDLQIAVSYTNCGSFLYKLLFLGFVWYWYEYMILWCKKRSVVQGLLCNDFLTVITFWC